MGVSSVGGNPNVVPTSSADTPERAPAAGPVPAPEAKGWVAGGNRPAPVAGPATKPSLLDKAEAKVAELALDQVANAHDVSQGFGVGLVQGNVKLSEQVALKGTDSHQQLVDSDPRRLAYEKANPDVTWVKTGAMVGASAGLPLGLGASVGLSGNVEVTSVAAQRVAKAGDLAGAAVGQAKSMALPLDAAGLEALRPAPGSEWMLRGQASASVGIGVGRSASASAGPVEATASVGASVGASASALFTKNVKVLDGQKVYVQVAQQTSEGVSASVGVDVGVSTRGSALAAGLAGKAEDRALSEAEKRTRLTASASGSASASQKVLGAAVLDLSTPAGRASYDYLLKATPQAAASYLERSGLGARYDESAKNASGGVSLQFGSTSLLSTNTFKGTTDGTLVDQGATTQLGESSYQRTVGGALPRLLMGEERNVSVRAGSITRDGVAQDAVALGMTLKDPKLTSAELGQLDRFARAMGAPLEGLPRPADGADAGKADVRLEVAVSDEGLKKLSQWDGDSVRLAFANAQKEIDGSAGLPPWYDQPQTFGFYRTRYQTANSSPHGPSQQAIAQEYKAKFGRDLSKDLDSARAVDDVTTQLESARGKPPDQWGPVLEAVGGQSSGDVRASMLALKRLAGAEVVTLSVSAQGKTVSATPQGAAPKSLAEVVGSVIAPPSP